MSDNGLAILAGVLILVEYVALVVGVWRWTDWADREFQLISVFFLPLLAMTILAPGTVAGLVIAREVLS